MGDSWGGMRKGMGVAGMNLGRVSGMGQGGMRRDISGMGEMMGGRQEMMGGMKRDKINRFERVGGVDERGWGDDVRGNMSSNQQMIYEEEYADTMGGEAEWGGYGASGRKRGRTGYREGMGGRGHDYYDSYDYRGGDDGAQYEYHEEDYSYNMDNPYNNPQYGSGMPPGEGRSNTSQIPSLMGDLEFEPPKKTKPKTTVALVPILHANPKNIPIPPYLCTMEMCNLCNIQMNAATQAKAHYEGRNHARKILQYFETYEDAEYNGIAEHPIDLADYAIDVVSKKAETKPEGQDVQAIEVDPNIGTDAYCLLCKSSFNTPAVAKLHYDGKVHQKKERYYIRMKMNSGDVSSLTDDSVKEHPKFYCELCDVTATRQDMLDMHLNGAKHHNKLRKKEREEQMKHSITVPARQ